MKMHITPDTELRDTIREALHNNSGYCPCVSGSKGKKEYKCICQDFLNNIEVGESCHCGLYIKDEK